MASRNVSIPTLVMIIKKQWKTILLLFLLGLIIGVGVGVFWGIVRKDPAWNETAAFERATADMHKYYEAKSVSEAIIEENTVSLKRLDELEENSILTDVNAWSVPTYKMIVQIVADDTERPMVAGELLLLLESEDFLDGIRKVLNVECDNQYIKELYTVTYRNQTGTIIIKTIHNNLTGAKSIAEYALEYLEEKAPTVDTDHTLKRLSAVALTEENTSLIDAFKRRKIERTTYINTITKEKDKLASLDEPLDVTRFQVQGRKQELVKYGLLGFLLGIFLSGMWVLGTAVSPDSPINREDFAHYSIPILYEKKDRLDRDQCIEVNNILESFSEVCDGLVILSMCDEDILPQKTKSVELERGMLKDMNNIHRLYQQRMIFLLNPDMVSLREFDNLIRMLEKMEASILGVVIV